MVSKYLLTLSEGKGIAIKHNNETDLVTMGGHSTVLDDIKFMAQNYFGKLGLEEKWTQKNKARVEFKMSRDEFIKGINSMRDDSRSIEMVSDHGRLMR